MPQTFTAVREKYISAVNVLYKLHIL